MAEKSERIVARPYFRPQGQYDALSREAPSVRQGAL